MEPVEYPDLPAFVLDRIAEDQRLAVAAAAAHEQGGADGDPPSPQVAAHVTRHEPARVIADCTARRRIAVACRDVGPDLSFLGSRPPHLENFLFSPADQHQLAALTLALLALPYADHRHYRQEWRP